MYLPNKYTQWYHNIITRAQLRVIESGTYTETHHIIPKSLGGNNANTNLVKLTAREHFICHWLLTKMVLGDSKRKMTFALHSMLHLKSDKRYTNSVAYEKNKIESAKFRSESMKGKRLGEENYNHGNKWSDAQRAKMSEFRTGKCFRPNYTYTEDAKNKMRESAKSRWTTEEREKFSQTRLTNMYEFTCPHCGTTGRGKSNYLRWHGSNCRSIKQ